MNIAHAIFVTIYLSLASVAAAVDKPTLPPEYEVKLANAVALLDGYRGVTSELEAAGTYLDAVLKAYPRHAPAHREKARYFIKRGHTHSLQFRPDSLKDAESSLNRAIEISPDYAEAFVLRGHLYRLMKRHQDAVRALEKAEELGTSDPWLQNNWADLLIDEGNYDAAAQRYNAVINSKVPNKRALGAAYEGLILCYKKARKLDKADEIYRKLIDLEPSTAWGHGNYAQFLLCYKDDYEGSIARSRQALNLMNYGAGRFWLASALYRKWAQSVLAGSPEEGRRYYLEALALHPDPSEIAARIATCPPLRHIAQALARQPDLPTGMLQWTPTGDLP